MRTQGAPGQGVLRETTRDNLFADVDTVKLTPEIYQAVESGDLAGVARRLSARYVVRGSFRADPEEKVTEARRLHVDAEIYDGRTGQKKRNSIDTKVDSLHEDLAGMASDLRAVIRVPQKFKTSFDSAEPGIMVYLDERFLGRTPFEIELPAGTFFMRLEQEGKTGSSRNLTVSGPARVNLQLGEKLLKCLVSVQTEPEGASVYLASPLHGLQACQFTAVPKDMIILRFDMPSKDYFDHNSHKGREQNWAGYVKPFTDNILLELMKYAKFENESAKEIIEKYADSPLGSCLPELRHELRGQTAKRKFAM
jgi:hypothetical protein